MDSSVSGKDEISFLRVCHHVPHALYHPRTIIVKDEKGDLVANSHSIMTRWRNYFSLLLNVHGAKDVRHAEIHTAEPLVPEPSAFEFELAVEKLEKPQITRY